MSTFGTYSSNPQAFSFWGSPGWFTVPSGRSWYTFTDKNNQLWVSPNPITVTNGKPTSSPVYAAELNPDGTLVFQDQATSRALGIDSPPRTWLSRY